MRGKGAGEVRDAACTRGPAALRRAGPRTRAIRGSGTLSTGEMCKGPNGACVRNQRVCPRVCRCMNGGAGAGVTCASRYTTTTSDNDVDGRRGASGKETDEDGHKQTGERRRKRRPRDGCRTGWDGTQSGSRCGMGCAIGEM